MITQVIWTDVNNRELDNIYARSGDEEIREIEFIICRNDPPEKVGIPAGVSGQFRMVKSSGNFVVRDMDKTVQEDGTVIFKVAVSDQMVNVQGTGYYDIRLSGGGYLYTASGRFIVDTPVISTSVLEDVSEVNGLVFPDDFLTTEDHFATIDDSIISSSSVWSSYKTNHAIEEAIEGIDIPSPIISYSSTPTQIGTWLDGSTPIYRIVIPKAIYIQGNSSVSEVINELPTKAVILDVAMVARVSGNNWYRCIIRPAVSYDTGGSHGMNFYYAGNQPNALWQSTHLIIDYIEEV